MNSFLRSLSLMVSLVVLRAANAQEGSLAVGRQGSGSVDPLMLPMGSTDESAARQDGFFGAGAEKQMQKVRGLPLPTRAPRQLYAASQSAGDREFNSSFSLRRSKQSIGELTTDFPARMVYLNGKNVSSIREQQLEGVNVRIDVNGNIHILAPHYEVQESTHYRPLLPHDLPKVSKPAPLVEEPLLSGRHSKPSNKIEEVKNLQATGGVPPITPSGEEPSANAAPVKPTESPAITNPSQNEKPMGGGQKL